MIGTKKGPEEGMVANAGIPFVPITAGKLRRYFSFANFVMPFQVIVGFFQSLQLIGKFKPDVVFGTGSFVQVPVLWAAWLKRVPVIIHQQDVVPSLANVLCQMCAKKITVTFESSEKDFTSGAGLDYKDSQSKVVVTGNPFRKELVGISREQGLKAFGLDSHMPVLLAFGGGTGASFINSLIAKAVPELTKYIQVLHVTGGRTAAVPAPRYQPHPFINNMGDAYAAADIVLGRAGLATITELSNLSKLAIIIPMPSSHQEQNGELLGRARAAIVIEQEAAEPELLVRVIRKLLFNITLQKELKNNISHIMPKDGARGIADIIIKHALHG